MKSIIILVIYISFSLFACETKSQEDLVLTQENHNKYYEKGSQLIMANVQFDGKTVERTSNKGKNLQEGIRYLDAVTKINPNNFAPFFLKGKAFQTLGEPENAYAQFKESFKLNKENPNVPRELAIECLNLGRGSEGVEVALYALSLDKNNSGLNSNLALAYLINGDLELANQYIKKAIELDSKDQINIDLGKIIDDVIKGKRPKPTKTSDIGQ